MRTYEEAVEQIWRHSDDSKNREETTTACRELIRYASLAPNSHNTQPWKFVVSKNESSIAILPDLTRSCSIVDPDNHHLYVSLGCAVENLVIAAKARGLLASVDMSSLSDKQDPQGRIQVTLKPCSPNESDLFGAIPKRQCTRNEYDGKPLTKEELLLLQEVTKGIPGVHAIFVESEEEKHILSEFVLKANAAQFGNRLFTTELQEWLRFSDKEAVAKGDGLIGKCFGNNAPSVPRWAGKIIFQFMVGPESEVLQRQLHSSAGIVVFASEHDDPTHWVNIGRCYERFALQATALDIKNAMINQPIEEATVRPDFQQAVFHLIDEQRQQEQDGDDSSGAPSLCRRADLVVRFGKSCTEMPRSLRRNVDDIMVVTKEK